MSAEQLITQHLDLWASAIRRKSSAGRGSSSKIELYGIKKLRELILELAVRGLLVPQDPNDEPASELLKKIAAEKARLVKEGKIKKEKPLPPIGEDERPFPTPRSWQLVRLLTLSQEIGTGPFGSMIHQSDYVSGGTPLVNPSHMVNDRIAEDADIAVNQEKARELSSYRLSTGDIVLARRGEVGRCALVTEREDGWLCGTGSFYLRLPLIIPRRFIALVFRAVSTRNYLAGKAVGTTMVNLNHGILNGLPVALPPLPEQHRIVAKVDELMVLCDQLEQQSDASLAAHQTLVATLLNALTSAAARPEPVEGGAAPGSAQTAFDEAWQRIADHFDALFTTEESIDQLKQTILQLAVMGKLVPQDPNDEPASELLKKIAAEKARLVKEGKIKKEKPLPLITEQEKPFNPPTGWALIRFGDLLINRDSERIPLSVDERATRRGDYDYYGASGVIDSIDDYLFDKPLLLIGEDGANLINRSTPIAFMARGKYWVNNHAHVLDGYSEELLLYVCLYVNAISLEPYVTGTAQPKMNQAKMNGIVLAIPPLPEQHRIVAKVDELMALCDQLKAGLSAAQTTQLQLADAMTEQALTRTP